jgi:SOS-response transcriptional repressor LexA
MDLIRTYREEHGHSPTVRDMCNSLHVSPNAVVCMLRLLRNLGVLEWDQKHARTIRFKGETPIYVRNDHVERVREFIRTLG